MDTRNMVRGKKNVPQGPRVISYTYLCKVLQKNPTKYQYTAFILPQALKVISHTRPHSGKKLASYVFPLTTIA